MPSTRYRLDPTPLDKQVRAMAEQLKTAGLPWTPAVGCFVWDPQGIISAPSPFPHRIYFILSMQRFLKIFGDVETMQAKLVWLPTWYQAIQLCRQLGINTTDIRGESWLTDGCSAEDELMHLYRMIHSKLVSSAPHSPRNNPSARAKDEETWMQRAMEADIGDLQHLPELVRDRIEAVYRTVTRAYVGWRRIQTNQADHWFPPEARFQPELIRELGHFYSDYQQPIKQLASLRRTVALLRSIDPDDDPTGYDQLIQSVLHDDHSSADTGDSGHHSLMDVLKS